MHYYCQCKKGGKGFSRTLREVKSTDGETCNNCGYYVLASKTPIEKGDWKNKTENDEREIVDYTEYRVLR